MTTGSRRVWVRLHMIGGLTLAVYATALGLSGSALVFREELSARGQTPRASGGTGAGPDAVIDAVAAEFPGWRVLSLTWPNRLSGDWMAYLLRDNEAREVFVDGGGNITEARVPGGGAMGWLLRFHTNFHSGSTGRLLNGIGGLALIGMAVSGLVLWYRAKGPWARLWHHNTGLAASAFLLVMGFTGGYYVWQSQYIAVVDRFFDRTPSVAAEATDLASEFQPLSYLLTRAQAAIPDRRVYRASVANEPGEMAQFSFLEGDELEFHKVSTVVTDPVTGIVVQVNRYEDRPLGNSLLAWFSVLHFGRFGGLAGRLLWFVLGLALPLLSVTGVMLWWRKEASRQESVVRRKGADAA